MDERNFVPEDAAEVANEEFQKGIVREAPGLGVYIQPSDDDKAVINFERDMHPGGDFDKCPNGFEIGDQIEFTIDPESKVNAKVVRKP